MTKQFSAKSVFSFLLSGVFAATTVFQPLVYAQELPTGAQIVAGQVSVGVSGDRMLIDQSSQNAIINWGSFSVGSGKSVFFDNGNGATLNRVVGAEISSINGTLSGTGSVYLINQNGIIIGEDGLIVTGGSFVGSTLDVSNADFLNGGGMTFAGASDARIVNLGDVYALGGDVAIIARNIENNGLLSARDGTVALVAGREVLMRDASLDGGKFVVKIGDVDSNIVEQGMIAAANVELRANGGNIYALAGNKGGAISATGVTNSDGRIFLTAGGGTVSVEKTVRATKANTGGEVFINANIVALGGLLDVSGVTGGEVSVAANTIIQSADIIADGSIGLGGRIELNVSRSYIANDGTLLSANGAIGGTINIAATSNKANIYTAGEITAIGTYVGGKIDIVGGKNIRLVNAKISASGANAGGQIIIGGDATRGYADSVWVAHNTVINADATGTGNGGSIIVFSQSETLAEGIMTAKGGSISGDGGLIEVSSKDKLVIATDFDATASHGTGGTILLDPKNIIIDDVNGIFPQYELIDPNADTGEFGKYTVMLSNGNIVVTDHLDDTGATDAGAAYLFNSVTGSVITSLIGSQNNDQVGRNGIKALPNGNYIIRSDYWARGAFSKAGAVTWVDGNTGISGVISDSNSMVGAQANDNIGSDGITILTNGNYVVRSVNWGNGNAVNAGAVTWGNGSTGTFGVVSASNSLVGTKAYDRVGKNGITVLNNGNYVVRSATWDNGTAGSAGAVTWGNGSTGTFGVVSASNSLVGSHSQDFVGERGVTALTNGNYVVHSVHWNNGTIVDAGAATWGDGNIGVSGVITSTNSLVGTQANDVVGIAGITALTNGNYVVISTSWDNGSIFKAGAATWGNGSTGTTGAVSVGNSLVGTQTGDLVGLDGVIALTNGNYVVGSAFWHSHGAVTWGDGNTGVSGVVSVSNSLVGTTPGDHIGRFGLTALTNGNYVVKSELWDNGSVMDAGAVTWGNGTTGIIGVISTSNSLVGTQTNDEIGYGGVTALSNGNYVVNSYRWNNGSASEAGSITWGNGSTGTIGVVSVTNSLVGTQTNDRIGFNGISVLTNDNYVVKSTGWDSGAVVDVGAVTWGNGSTGTTGEVSASNSLVGVQTNDNIGNNGIFTLTNGNYIVKSSSWDNGTVVDVGAVTWGNGTTGVFGVVSASNSLIGSQTADKIGSGSVAELNNGNYVVTNTNWDNGAVVNVGAVTWVNGSTGTSGIVSSDNSLVGNSTGAGLRYKGTNSTSDIFVAASGRDQRVVIGFFHPNQLTFARATSQTVTFKSDFIVNILSKGQNVELQASNDITVNSDIVVNNTNGNGGNLILSAGRSLLINANINTDNGNLGLFANDFLGSGVVDVQRDAGAAVITFANGVNINLGNGDTLIEILDGTGKTNLAAGDITFMGNNNLIANVIGIINQGVEANNAIVLGAGTVITASGNGNALLLISDIFTNNADANALALSGSGRYLVYSYDRDLNTRGDLVANNLYGHTPLSASPNNVAAGDHFIYEQRPILTIRSADANVTYDGNAHTLSGYTVAGLINGDSFATALSSNPVLSGSYNQAGNYSGFLSGAVASSQGYILNIVQGTLTIDPKLLTLSGVTINDKVYDGNVLASLNGNGALVGIVGGDVVNVNIAGIGATFTDVNVGAGKAVTVTGYALSGAAASNYIVSNPTGLSADITAISSDYFGEPLPDIVRTGEGGVVFELCQPLSNVELNNLSLCSEI